MTEQELADQAIAQQTPQELSDQVLHAIRSVNGHVEKSAILAGLGDHVPMIKLIVWEAIGVYKSEHNL
jgi:hypothetical protein